MAPLASCRAARSSWVSGGETYADAHIHLPVARVRSELSAILTVAVDHADADRLELLDRIAERVPELDLAQQSIAWMTLDDGSEALLVNGGGIDGGDGAYFANAGDDLHAVGSLAPLIPGAIGCIVIKPDGSRSLAHAVPDPLAQKPN